MKNNWYDNRNKTRNQRKKKEIKNDIRNTTGIIRLLYNPSCILAPDILCVNKLRFGLLTYNHSQQFIKPVEIQIPVLLIL